MKLKIIFVVKALPKVFHHSKPFEKKSTIQPNKKIVTETDLSILEESQEDCIQGGSGILEPKCKCKINRKFTNFP